MNRNFTNKYFLNNTYFLFSPYFFLVLLCCVLVHAVSMWSGIHGMIYTFYFLATMHALTYFWADKIVLYRYGAIPLERAQYSHVYDIMAELTQNAGVAMPTLWLIEHAMPNAFATGRNPSHSSIALTRGILHILDHDELRGVLAHELSHITNRDTLIHTIAAILASMVVHTTYAPRRNREGLATWFIMTIVLNLAVRILVTLLQLALSRSREYLADHSAGCLTKDPLALARALAKLDQSPAHNTAQWRGSTMAHALCIVNPLSQRSHYEAKQSNTFTNVFATHPPLQKRIEKLEQLHEELYLRH
jgi:heat shock protein HtpX